MATTIDEIAADYDNFLFKFGRKVIGAAKEIIWDGVDPYKGFLAADTLFSVISTHANDKVGGGGATHIKFIYQDLAGVEYLSPEIALNALVAVDIPTITGVVAYRAFVTQTEDTSPLTGPNHGAIKIYATGDATAIHATITALEGQTLMLIYRVPMNKYAEVKSFHIDGSEGKGVSAWVKTRRTRLSPWLTKATFQVFQSGINIERKNPGFIYPGSDIIVMGLGSAATTTVDGHLELELKDIQDGVTV